MCRPPALRQLNIFDPVAYATGNDMPASGLKALLLLLQAPLGWAPLGWANRWAVGPITLQ